MVHRLTWSGKARLTPRPTRAGFQLSFPKERLPFDEVGISQQSSHTDLPFE
jgi:hypothetical protein